MLSEHNKKIISEIRGANDTRLAYHRTQIQTIEIIKKDLQRNYKRTIKELNNWESNIFDSIIRRKIELDKESENK